MSRVYILQDNPHAPKNFLPAEEFGELVVLFNHHIGPSHISRCVSQLRDKLRGVTKDDWLIPVGHPLLILAAGHVWFDLTSQLNCLVWERELGRYVPIRINSHGRTSTEDYTGSQVIGRAAG